MNSREQKPTINPEALKKIKTPDWILTKYPDVDQELSPEIVEEFNSFLTEAKEKWEEAPDHDCSFEEFEKRYVFTTYMNNFSSRVTERIFNTAEDKLGTRVEELHNGAYDKETGQPLPLEAIPEEYQNSELLRNKTWAEFIEDIRRAIEESNLSLDEVKKLQTSVGQNIDGKKIQSWAANEYLLPAFIKLRQMGYKSCPDLTT